MVSLQNRDERLKIIVYMSIALTIQGLLFVFIFYNSFNNINNKILEQNFALVGYVNNRDSNIAKEIIPIITNKNVVDKDTSKVGEDILSKYSYSSKLGYKDNPLIGVIFSKYIFIILLIVLVITGAINYGVIYLIDPLYKEIRYLTSRAENIIENKTIEKERDFIYKGSLDKFILKFSMMEERIYNSLDLLKKEKINLKNIINDISHQLKTPLMALLMYNEILKDHRNMESEEVDNFINLGSEQLDRMEWLIKTLLKYARLESNVVEYHKNNYLLNNTIEESINPLVIKAKEKNQEIIFNTNKQIYLYHDRKWIAEAISNIIKNAIEHTGVKGRIEIGMEETPISIRVWIKDNGEGIEKSEIKKIFNRFHKGQNSINPTSIGIGLCLSKAILKAHNGDITVESKIGEGSIFYITFIKTV